METKLFLEPEELFLEPFDASFSLGALQGLCDALAYILFPFDNELLDLRDCLLHVLTQTVVQNLLGAFLEEGKQFSHKDLQS